MNGKSSNRYKILTSVEFALGLPARDDAIVRPRTKSSDPQWVTPDFPWESLGKELEGLSARFHQPSDLKETRRIVREICEAHQVRKAVRWKHPLIEALGMDELLRRSGVEILSSENTGDLFSSMASRADLGITAADL
jgi:L-lactate utilization protein LutC